MHRNANGACLRATPSKASIKARYVVNRKMTGFPTGRKRFYNSRPKFPTGRKGGLRLAGEDDKTSRRPETPDTTAVRAFIGQVERNAGPDIPEPRISGVCTRVALLRIADTSPTEQRCSWVVRTWGLCTRPALWSARSVRLEIAADLALIDGETHIVEGGNTVITVGQPIDFEHARTPSHS